MHDEKQTFPLQENLIGVMSASWTLWRKVLLAKREHKSRARNLFCVHNSVNSHGYFKSYIRNYHLPSPPLFALSGLLSKTLDLKWSTSFKLNFLSRKTCHPGQSKENLFHMQMQKEQKGVAEAEFEMLSDYWCMRKFCAFEWRLLEFQHPFLLSCAAQPIWFFWIFNGYHLLCDTEKVRIHEIPHAVLNRYFEEFCQNFDGKTPANLSHIRTLFHQNITVLVGWNHLLQIGETRGERFWFTTV